MAGIVYLRTNRFEVKLEGITFKSKDFESLCSMDFLFLGRNTWASPPIVGIDVMCHPRDPSIVLVLFCFGVGCMILRFHSGDLLPEAIRKFLSDQRIRFVAFGIPEKNDLFPFEKLGLTKNKVDIGYLAAKNLSDSKYKRCDLAELALKVLGVKNMIGLTDALSLERHEQIKCSICQLFITSAIGMVLLNANEKKKLENAPKSPFRRNLLSLPLFVEEWLNFRRSEREIDKTRVQRRPKFDAHPEEEDFEPFANDFFQEKDDSSGDDLHLFEDKCRTSGDVFHILASSSTNYPSKEEVSVTKPPLKGILKCPSSGFQNAMLALKRANSKGCNVSFK